MRSRSSVLSHILGSSPEVCGYSELLISYLGYENLIKMKIDLTNDLKCNLKDKYLLDKILHNHLSVSRAVLAIAKPKIIFLLREPEATIKSMVSMGIFTKKEKWDKNPYESALEYYCSRLEYLEKYARDLDCEYFFIQSDDLLKNTEAVLLNLSKWLNLRENLVPEYSIFSKTGMFGNGDPSENIKLGILKETDSYPDIEIPFEALNIGKASYDKCRASLLSGAEKSCNFY
jgi:Sulfotransferase family